VKIATYLLTLLFIAGCGSASEEETIGKAIADDYNRAMDEAAAVEDQLREQQRQVEDALNEAESTTREP